jgi:hypothetical protein
MKIEPKFELPINAEQNVCVSHLIICNGYSVTKKVSLSQNIFKRAIAMIRISSVTLSFHQTPHSFCRLHHQFAARRPPKLITESFLRLVNQGHSSTKLIGGTSRVRALSRIRCRVNLFLASLWSRNIFDIF